MKIKKYIVIANIFHEKCTPCAYLVNDFRWQYLVNCTSHVLIVVHLKIFIIVYLKIIMHIFIVMYSKKSCIYSLTRIRKIIMHIFILVYSKISSTIIIMHIFIVVYPKIIACAFLLPSVFFFFCLDCWHLVVLQCLR